MIEDRKMMIDVLNEVMSEASYNNIETYCSGIYIEDKDWASIDSTLPRLTDEPYQVRSACANAMAEFQSKADDMNGLLADGWRCDVSAMSFIIRHENGSVEVAVPCGYFVSF